jgi:hypothetical protein
MCSLRIGRLDVLLVYQLAGWLAVLLLMHRSAGWLAGWLCIRRIGRSPLLLLLLLLLLLNQLAGCTVGLSADCSVLFVHRSCLFICCVVVALIG